MRTNKVSYQQYLKDQITRAQSKWGRKHDYDEIFKQLLNLSIDEAEEFVGQPKSICCMGCRAGTEVFEFKERYPSAEVYGVDITENVHTIRTHLDVHIELHDFNKLPEDWTDKFDLVFSNSLDHAFEPKATIQEWYRVTENSGHLLLELSTTSTNIEHSFKPKDADKLLPTSQFEHLLLWPTPERNSFTGLFKVLKNV